MSCDDRSPRTWRRVRDNSVFELKLVPSDDRYAQEIRVITNPGQSNQVTESWKRSDVTPGPKRKTLRAGNEYEVQVFIFFLGDAVTSVEVQARMLRPDGQLHGRSFCEHHAGKKGDGTAFSLLAIFMRAE